MSFPDEFEILVDGRKIKAREGWTIAEALLSADLPVFRKTRNNAPRSVYCNMGVCYECRMIVNGVPNVRTCNTFATPDCRVFTQADAELEPPHDES